MFLSKRSRAAFVATGAVTALLLAAFPANAGGREFRGELDNAGAAEFLPPSLASEAEATYLVTLKGDPAALKRGNQASLRASVLKSQAEAIAAATKAGATITQRYADAVNGFAFVGNGRAAMALQRLGSVVSVSKSATYTIDNAAAAVQTGAASAWETTGYTGKGVKVAIIDSGIDYFHKMFGGAGAAAFDADDSTIIEPGSFPTTKVVGGYDFVGDSYDARYSGAAYAPKPDADPRDCAELNGKVATAGGHGSHVAGTAAGYGVTTDGSTFRGPWTAAATGSLKIGAGMAPEASLLAYRVFGCFGSTDDSIVVAAINRAVADGAKVINMSLGSPFGRSAGTEQTAIANAVKAGVLVVASAGNSGPNAYITGAPASAPAALSVAALSKNNVPSSVDIIPSSGSTVFNLTPGGSGALPASGLTVYSSNLANSVTKLGCNVTDFQDADGNSLVTGKLVAISRGSCTFVTKEANAYANGAAAVVLINNTTGSISPAWNGLLPLLVLWNDSASTLNTYISRMYAMHGKTVTYRLYNYGLVANFSSGGPRYGDGGFKPDISAPGVGIRSTEVGTGDAYADYSGTSMAAPATAGSAALVRQARPDWSATDVKAALVNTASRDSSLVVQNTRLTGNGIVQPKAALTNGLLVYPSSIVKDGDTSLSFGVRQDAGSANRLLTIANTTSAAQTVTLSSAITGSPSGASMTFSKSSFTLAAGTKTVVTATLTLTSGYLAARGNTSSTIKTLFGQVIATRGDGLVSTVPFSAVPAARSNYSVTSDGKSVTVANRAGAVGSGTAETYEWLMADAQDTPSASDIRSLGAQYWTEADLGLSSSADGFIVFNLSTYNQIYNPADTEWDVYIDTNKDGYDDYLLVGFDAGYMTTGSGSGKIGWFLYYWDNAKGWTSKAGAYSYWAPLNSSTLQFGVQASALGMPASAPGSFQIDGLYAFSWTGETDWTPGISGTIDPYNPQRSYGDWAGGATGLAPGQSTAWGLATRPLAAGETRTLGWVVSTADNRTGMQSTEIRGF